MTSDGRIALSLNLDKRAPPLPENYAKEVREFAVDTKDYGSPPLMNIVIMIVGSRGEQDVLRLRVKLNMRYSR